MNLLTRIFRRKPRFPMDCTHEFKMTDWTDLNGDPRCLHCGKYFIDKILKENPASHFAAVVSEGDVDTEVITTIVWKLKPIPYR